MYFYFYQVCMIVSLIISLSLVVLIWRRRHSPGAGAMVALVMAIFVWALGFYLEANSDTLGRQLFFNNIGYLGSMSVPVAWFVFALNYSSSGRLIRGWKTSFFCIAPFIITILIWTNNYHHLMWSNEHLGTSGSFLVTVKTYGPVFWVALAHNYLYILAGGIILLRRLFTGPRLYKEQAIALIFGVCLPWIWNIIYVFQLLPLPRKDLTPVMFAFSGIALTFGLLRFRLFETIPFAWEFIVRQLKDGVLVFNVNNCLVDANPAALRILGTGRDIVGKTIIDLVSFSPVFERLSLTGFTNEELSLTVAGEKRFFEPEITPIMNNKQRQAGWLIMLHDITERKKMEEQLIMEDRLASVGQLTSGLAHEINNPLTSVISFSSILLDMELSEEVKQDLETIHDEAKRAADIVKNLISFTRKQSTEKQPININDSIRKVLELRAYEQKVNNIHINLQLDPALPRVNGNDSQLQQVFFNIVINAEYFMGQAHGKGTLTITTEKAEDCVRISFTDDGPGISGEDKRRLFTPFFSTKEAGKGTGLSLSIGLGIITDHGGKMRAESEAGKGAAFIIELPVSREKNSD